ncbi:hypothetical protein A3E46_02345 [Candidatus Woesebacteria bacterium RIFCSPHIGHO2_12_FULL_46_16]|uniref:Uncharacterized protein n=1 Tax=Candidatus Woesebacteria bacterium RIFCSPHIGHO2_12_FULL_46_16 TaxID=1802513 RepID=A0A1F8B0R1_9BACT|nr:MAG: hypothetical protein A3E46_02345 [Candidatus Woesebacteria bacterium RIFCSPHIGHO2_12_FULL_46_16]
MSIETKLMVKLPLSVAIVIREKPVPAGAEETTFGLGVGLLVGEGVDEFLGVAVGVGDGPGEASWVGDGEGVASFVFGKKPLFPIIRKDTRRTIIKSGRSRIKP